MKYTCINIQGNLISEELLQKIENATADGQSAEQFGLEPGTNLRSEIEYAWSRIKLDWKHFSERMQNLPATDQYGTSLSRKWMKNFFSSLGFELQDQKNSLVGENKQGYNISHTSSNLDDLPIHVVGFFDPHHPDRNTLDMKASGGTTRLSPHALVQEYLNVTEHLYGIATNGLYLRLLRDSGRLVKLTYIEFDLKRLLEEDRYSEFTLLYRMLHASRFPRNIQETDRCLLEKYYQESIETGNRIRDGLSTAVKESLLALGKGFLQHEYNTSLRDSLKSGRLTTKDLNRQLLRLIYRFLFLMVTEERDLVYDPEEKTADMLRKKRVYLQYYSLVRLRKLSRNKYLYEPQFSDLWQGLVQTFQLFDETGGGRKLGISPLGGDLFNSNALPHLEQSYISNNLLLECVRNMNEFEDDKKNLVSINYRSLDVEELGSVYEGLLELHPVIEYLDADNPRQINFTFHGGTDRKTTGSYYTRPDLVNELIKSALIPVIKSRLSEHADKNEQAKALLKLKVCDAAAGSGHMLLAAARTIAWYLAQVKTGEENPAPSAYRSCLREVIQHCVYAVDMNPDAVELCKLALWLEGHNSGKPLSFLDHKVRNGNSLVGVTDLSVLTKGIPDEAFNPVTGDDKDVCKKLKKDNTTFNKTKIGNLFDSTVTIPDTHIFSDEYHELDDITQDDVAAVQKAKQKFDHIRNDAEWYKEWRACNLWTAAFFYTYTEEAENAAPNSERLQKYLQNPAAAYGPMIGKADALQAEHKFFHWPLEFPDVWSQGGFDVILGNPPWEIVELNAKEFFKTRNKEIADAESDQIRKSLIDNLKTENVSLYQEYLAARHDFDSQRKFIQESSRFPNGSKGRIDLYPLFVENSMVVISPKGITGLIVPSDIATGAYNSDLFSLIVREKRLKCYFDFENSKGIFPGVHRSKRFCVIALTGINATPSSIDFFYFGHELTDLLNNERRISLKFSELELYSPSTLAPPIFHNSHDYAIAQKAYKKFGVFIDKKNEKNRWSASVKRMFSLSDAGVDFKKNFQLSTAEKKQRSRIYSGKNIFQYNHRFASHIKGKIIESSTEELCDPEYTIETEYYVPEVELENRLKDKKPSNWLIGYRDVTNATNERTCICSILPRTACDTNCRNIFSNSSPLEILCLVGNLNSIPFDYFARQKIIGLHLNAGTIEQLPVLLPSQFNAADIRRIAPLVLELTFTSWDIKAFADEVWQEADAELKIAIEDQWQLNKEATGGHEWAPPEWCEITNSYCPLPPFKWDEDRRAVLKAELDAIYANLYGFSTEELRYILDPQEVYGKDFPGETFRVLKDKEIRQYGEYRTRRLVLEAWGYLDKKSINSLDLSRISEPMKEFSLDEGIYSIQDVAHITQIPAKRVRRWFKDLSAEQYEGLTGGQQSDVDNMRVSFHGLIEVVVIDTLRENKFSLKAILVARNDLKQKTGKNYPFATNNVRDNLKIAGKALVFRFESGDVTLNGSGQYNLAFIQDFFKHIEFDNNGIAQRLFKTDSRLIVIDPKQGGGKAVVNGKGVWAETIAMSYSGPASMPVIRDQYDVTDDEISAAIEYCN
ncbi:MAG: Eco57I restriction-modification methylase domain-containing protein [Bacteroidetes bacterium]|nr:Eco57I restriction-modification methylase domain-containing protein [Bacteroidota bacterium]